MGLGGGNYEFSWLEEKTVNTCPLVDDIINSAFVIGVNLFILITGWFGVRSIGWSLFRLLPIYLFVVLLVMLVRKDISPSTYNMNEWWFLPNFIILILLSPLIESSIKEISKKTYTYFIVLLIIVNILFGYWWGYVNWNGYNFLNFIFLYYIARYCRIQSDSSVIKYLKKWGVLVYVFSFVVMGICHTILENTGHHKLSNWYWGYNNPIILIESISLFLWLGSRNITSKIVNYLAGGVFAVYLLSTKEFSHLHIGEYGRMVFVDYSYWGFFVYTLTVTMIMLTPCAIINDRLLLISFKFYEFIRAFLHPTKT